jgi:hypothetical protein
MKDCSKDIIKFHNQEVTLPIAIRDKIRANRNANRDRLKRGLKAKAQSQPDESIIQGSYAMKTMTQHPENDYDIDDGAAFNAEKLLKPDGIEMTAVEAKTMVRDALLEGHGLRRDPEIKPNCVRVEYAAGHHIDIPVYRRILDDEGELIKIEIASKNWRESNPREITEWFRHEEEKSKVEGEEEPQLRRLVRLLKIYARSNLEQKSLSGLILTVLAAEVYCYHDPREDRAFSALLRAVGNRIRANKEVRNPADYSEVLTKEIDDSKMEALIGQIDESLDDLEKLDRPYCSGADAREVWDRIFCTDFFSKLPTLEESEPCTPSYEEPKTRVYISGSGRSA